MNKAMQALLWAALIFPGAGHLFLKHIPRGIALVTISLLSLVVLLFRVMHHAHGVVEQALADGALDLTRIVGQTLQATAVDHVLQAALWVLALCWLFGMVDAYRLGKKMQA